MTDFIDARELSRLTGINLKTLYNQHSAGTGPLASILTKLGNKKLGAWRLDYEQFVASQRRLKSPMEQQRSADLIAA